MNMTNETFKFSPRVGLIMANLKTVRDVIRILKEKEGEGQTDIKKLLKYVKNNLKDRIPEIKPWGLNTQNNCIYISPGNQWRISDDTVSIFVDFNSAMVPYRLDNDPSVGLYVPDWPQRKVFNEKLIDELGTEFMNNWDEPEDECPIWTYVKYENYAKGDDFDVKGFGDDIVSLVAKLIGEKEKFDNVLKNIKEK